MVAAGGSFVAHDLEYYVIEEELTYFNEIFSSREVGHAYKDPYAISFFLI
jgi:hypothetical protein